MDYMDYADTMEIEIQKIENALDILENYLRGRKYENIHLSKYILYSR